jgi:hypothetical protein
MTTAQPTRPEVRPASCGAKRRLDEPAVRSTTGRPLGVVLFLALVLALVLALSSWAHVAHACSCEYLSHTAAVRRYPVALRARVVATTRERGQLAIALEVLERWKGLDATVTRVTLRRPLREGQCPIPSFRASATYDVYADRDGDDLRVRQCNPTRLSKRGARSGG